jgi:hypothetical protein
MLTLSEELLLLAVHDEKGSVILSTTALLPYGVAASILLDLKYLGKIDFKDEKLNLITFTPTGIDFLDEMLIFIKNQQKIHKIRWWIKKIATKNSMILEKIFEKLVLEGILKREKHNFMFMVDFFRYPTLNPVPELETRDKIHKSVLMGIKPDEKLAALISLMYFCGLVKEVFPAEQRKKAKKSIKNLIDSDKLSYYLNDIVTELSVVIAGLTILKEEN